MSQARRSWMPFEAWTGTAAASRPSRSLARRRWSAGRVGAELAPPPTLESLALQQQQTRTGLVLLAVAVAVVSLINVGAAFARSR